VTRTVCQVWIGDGRDNYHREAIDSIRRMLPPADHVVHIDDRLHLLGFSGAVQAAWDLVLDSGCEFVFHCELDFTYNEPVPVDRMIGVLDRHPEVVQLSLKRQPVNQEERAAGDILRVHWEDYHEVADGEDVWVEQRRFFTTNPSLYRAELCKRGWPQEQYSEGKFTGYYRRDFPEDWFGIWGAKTDPPRVTHIGEHRTGNGY
jgi:hypothetical protein